MIDISKQVFVWYSDTCKHFTMCIEIFNISIELLVLYSEDFNPITVCKHMINISKEGLVLDRNISTI